MGSSGFCNLVLSCITPGPLTLLLYSDNLICAVSCQLQGSTCSHHVSFVCLTQSATIRLLHVPESLPSRRHHLGFCQAILLADPLNYFIQCFCFLFALICFLICLFHKTFVTELVQLPGVGKKDCQCNSWRRFRQTGYCCWYPCPGRVSNRLGLAHSKDPVKVEAELNQQIEKNKWTLINHALILHGRETCKARRPDCYRCVLFVRNVNGRQKQNMLISVCV